MALDKLTKVTTSGITSTIPYDLDNINSTGIITASAFVGDGSGVTGVVAPSLELTGSYTIQELSAVGVITASTFVGDGSGLTGVTASGVGIEIKDSGSIVGVAGTIDFGTNLNVSPASAGIVTITTGDSDFTINDKIVHTGDTDTSIRFPADDTVTIETAGSERVRVDSSGNTGIGTNNPQRLLHLASTNPRIRLDDTDSGGYYTELRQGGSATYLHLDGGNVGSGNFRITADGGSEIFRFNDKGNVTIEGSTTSFDANPTIDGLQLYYETDTRLATIASYDGTSGSEISIGTNDGSSDVVEAIRIKSDGNIGIGTDNPTATLDVNGTLNVAGVSTFNNNVNLLDNDNLYLGTDQDLRIYHSGSNAIIRNYTGGLFIDNEVDNGDITIRTDDGSGGTTEYIQCDGSRGTVELYYYGTQKFETTASGIDVTGHTETDTLSVTGVSTFQNNIHLLDDDRLQIGGSVGTVDGLEIYHDGSNSYINDTGTGALQVRTSALVLRSNVGENMAFAYSNGAVQLYYNNSKTFETTTTGIEVFNGASTSATIAGPDEIVIDPATVGDNTGSVRIKGDLFVDGTTTQINSTTIELADFIVGIATTATTDTLADGAGIQIGPDNTFLYEYNSGTNPSLKSSENLNVATGKHYQIGETEVLNATTLGSGVVNSSLTSVGTLTGLTVSGDISIADKIIHTGDTNTAIRFPANDTFTVETAGSERVRIDSSGNVGIGTENPRNSAKLDVHNSTANGVYINYDGTSNTEYGLRIESNAAGGNFESDFVNGTTALLDLYANSSIVTGGDLLVARTQSSTPVLLVKGNGSVGIGTNNPSFALDVQKDVNTLARFIRNTDGDSFVRINSHGGNVVGLQLGDDTDVDKQSITSDNTANALYFNTANSESMRIDSSGNVGIGTNSPQRLLDIFEDGATDTVVQIRSGTANRDKARITKVNRTTGSGELLIKSSSGANSHSIVFLTDSSGEQRMHIEGDGNVGIGTAIPAEKLSVAGNVRVENSADVAQYLNLTYQGIDFQNTGAGSSTTSSSHLLDDYEEGTWTPEIFDILGSSASATYSTRVGNYTKIGNVVTVTGVVVLATASGSGTAIGVRGLPFANSSGANDARSSGPIGNAQAFQGEYPTHVLTGISNAHLQLRSNDRTLASSNTDAANLTNSSRFDFAVTYFVD